MERVDVTCVCPLNTSLALREEEVRGGEKKVNKHVTPIQSGSFQFLRRRVEHPIEMFVKDMELINP